MPDISSIPLNKLVDSAENARKTAGADGALQELAASIAAYGLLQSLVVRKSKKGKFAVVAGGLPRSLVESLTAHRTAALAVTLSQQPKVALAAVVHALALRTFYGHGGDSCLQIFAKDVSLKLAEGSKAREFLEIATETWREHLPGNADDLFAWCLEQLAQCAALSVHAVQAKIDRPDTDRLVHAQALAQALSLDMATWFTPNAANFFGKLTKTGIVEALTEAREGAVAPAWLKAKKADLVNIAEREVANTGWLPAPLRRAA